MSAIVEIENGEGLLCPYCIKPSKSKGALKTHIYEKHRDEHKQAKGASRPFQCECGDRFPRKPDLKYH